MVRLRKTFVAVSALGIIAAATFFILSPRTIEKLGRDLKFLILGMKVGDSPVMASGGSMTFRAQSTWNCYTPERQNTQKCVTANKLSPMSLDANYVDPVTANQAFGWAGLNSWILDLYARKPDGTPVQDDGSAKKAGWVRICTSNSNVAKDATCGSGNYVLIAVMGVGAKGNPNSIGLAGSSAVEPANTPYAGTYYAEQYFDSDCNSHNASNMEACEHPRLH